MIDTVGALLQDLIAREAAVLAKQNLQHAPTIGAMYEGLTKDALRRTLPGGVGLSVVSGFARGQDGGLSRQLDCMLVVGDGQEIPHTSTFIYPVEQVLAVVEVKKSLRGAEFEDAFRNLRSVRLKRSGGPLRRHVESAFQLISGRALPTDEKDIVDPVLRQTLYQVFRDASYPARVLLGYEGYKSVEALRRGVVAQLSRLVGHQGGGPSSLPDVILNPKAAVVKANGFPYIAPMNGARWPVLLSVASELPAKVLLEVIWTRLQMHAGGAPEMFGEDLRVDTLVRLADYEYVEGRGWEVHAVDVGESELHVDEQVEWEPTVISDAEHAVLLWIGQRGEIDMAAPPAGSDQDELGQSVARLESARLIGLDASRSTVYRYLTKECGIAVLPDGRVVAGENVSGRLSRWVMNNLKR